MLDENAGLELVGEPRSLGEFGIDLAEIHLAQIKLRELVESEALALLFLGLVPRLGQLAAALLLENARQLGFKAAVGFALGQTDAEKFIRAVSPDIGAQALRIALVEQHFLTVAAERDQQADPGDQRKALTLAAIEHAKDLGGAGVACAPEQRQRLRVERSSRFVHCMKRGDRILELVIRGALDRLAGAVDAVDIAVADILGCFGIACRKRAFVNSLPGLTWRAVSKAFLAQEAASSLVLDLSAIARRCSRGAAIASLPSPAGPRYRYAVDNPCLRRAVSADLGIERAVAVVRQAETLAFVRHRIDGAVCGYRICRIPGIGRIAGNLGDRIARLRAEAIGSATIPLETRAWSVPGNPA